MADVSQQGSQFLLVSDADELAHGYAERAVELCAVAAGEYLYEHPGEQMEC